MALTKVPSNLDATVATTQSASDNSTNVATTAYVTTAIANLSDSAPAALNTLNEIAAALGDDANYASTTTAAIAAKLPLAGGTMTGTLNITQASTADTIKLTRTTTSQNNMIKFASDSADKWIIGQRNDSTEHFRFYSYGTSSDVLSIQTDGNVGIGTSSPAYGLDVLGATNYKTVRFGQAAATGTKRQAIAARHYTSSEQDHNMIGMFTDANTNSILAIGGGLGSTGDFNSVTQIQLHTGNGTTTNTTAAMTLDDNGNVGIGGAADASGRLLISNSGTNQIVCKPGSGSTNLNMGNFSGGGYISNNYYYSSGHQNDDSSSGSYEMYIGPGDNVAFNYMAAGSPGSRRRDLVIDNANGGRVGIGTNSPVSKLHVYSSAATSAPKDTYAVGLFDDTEGRIQVRATNSGSDGAVVGLSTGSHNWGLMATAAGTFSNAFAIGYANTSTDGNVFGVDSMSEKLVITTSGNVGIGTGSPDDKLDIMGGGYDQIRIGSNKTDNTNKTAGIVSTMYTNNSVSFFQGFFQNGNNAVYYGSADGAHRGLQRHYFYVNDNYNATSGHTLAMQVGSSSTTALVVNGNSSTGGTVNWTSTKGSNESHAHYGSNGDWYIRPASNSGTVYVKNYQAESDRRLKENIEDITYGTAELLQLRPRKFNWIDGSGEQNGFVAQEVESVIPSFVATGDMKINGHEEEEGIKSVSYNSIVATLVKSVQEQQAIIDDLKSRIETLEG